MTGMSMPVYFNLHLPFYFDPKTQRFGGGKASFNQKCRPITRHSTVSRYHWFSGSVSEFNVGTVSMDLGRAEKLLDVLASIVDYPLSDDSPRVRLSATLAVSSLQFAAAARVLCGAGLVLGASTTLRCQFEALVRSVWALHRATEGQIERLSADLNQETQQASKNIPLTNEMLIELEKMPQLKNLLVSLNEFKSSSWQPLNSFVHAGIHAVLWTRHDPPPQLLENIFRASNGLALLAFLGIGILTGRSHVQSELVSAAASFSSVLPAHKECK